MPQGEGEQYRGRDRRSRTAFSDQHRLEGQPARLAALAAAGVAALGAGWLAGADVATLEHLGTAFAALAATATGALVLVQWRITGAAFAAWVGAALACYGVATLIFSTVVSRINPSSTVALGRLAVCGVVGVLVWRATHSFEVDTGLSPMRLLTTAAGATTLLALGAIVPFTLAPTGLRLPAVTVALGATVLGWLASATMLARSTRRLAGVAGPVMLGCLAAAAGARLAAHWDSATWLVLAPGALAGIGMLIAIDAEARQLAGALRTQSRLASHLNADLRLTQDLLVAEQEALEERLHELRNTVAATRAADFTLRRYAARLDERTRANLAEGLSAELDRLQVLIEPGGPTVAVDFSLAAHAAAVIAGEQALGGQVSVDLADVHAHGDGVAFAQVLQNLLVNARRHAPGSPVSVAARQHAGHVEVLVADRGPGIALEDRMTIFARGGRARAAEGRGGDGLGLYISSRLLSGMGGRLRVVDQDGPGACFLIELPGARRSIHHGAGTSAAALEDVNHGPEHLLIGIERLPRAAGSAHLGAPAPLVGQDQDDPGRQRLQVQHGVRRDDRGGDGDARGRAAVLHPPSPAGQDLAQRGRQEAGSDRNDHHALGGHLHPESLLHSGRPRFTNLNEM